MLENAELVGFVELQVGSIEIKVPLREAPRVAQDVDDVRPLAAFEVDGEQYAIVVRAKDRSPEMMEAVQSACEDALRHLSKKLLN